MMVVDRRRWHRAKIVFALIIGVIDVACAGGFEPANETTPMPSFVGFCTFAVLLFWLTVNIIQEGKRL